MAATILILVGITALCVLLLVNKVRNDPREVRDMYAGHTENQKQVIRYFKIDKQGCLKDKLWTDADFDNYLQEKIRNTKQKALDKLGIDEEQVKEIDPINFQSRIYYDEMTKANALRKIGEDGIRRTSIYQAIWLFFSAKQILVCKINLNLIDETVKDKEYEYFYKDVTNISIEEMSDADGIESYMEFKIIVPGAEFSCHLYDYDDNEERSIKAMRALLREKKS